MLLSKRSKLLVLDDEIDNENIKRESDSSLEEDNGNIDFDYYIDLSISDGKAL